MCVIIIIIISIHMLIMKHKITATYFIYEIKQKTCFNYTDEIKINYGNLKIKCNR